MKRSIVVLLGLLTFAGGAAADSKIVVSIKPIHSLVASVTDGIETPEVIVKGADSLHGYQIKPSDAKLLENADAIFWIGPTLESTLAPFVSSVPTETTVIEVGEIHGLQLYESRESPDAHHDHDGEHSEGEKVEEHAEHDEHQGEEEEHNGHEEEDHGEEEHHGDEHGHGFYDMHVWLDVSNARVITEEAAARLAQIYPQHEAAFVSNMNSTLQNLDALEAEIRDVSVSFADSPYVVFHDAYQYLEKMLGLNNVGTVTMNPEHTPSAKRVLELREKISETGAICVFNEPQFDAKIVEVIAEGTSLKIGTLDPLGADIEPGPDAYFELIRNMVHSLKNCLE